MTRTRDRDPTLSMMKWDIDKLGYKAKGGLILKIPSLFTLGAVKQDLTWLKMTAGSAEARWSKLKYFFT